MPYKSDAQRRFFHTSSAAKAGITPSEVHEFDEASKGDKLPEYAAEGGEAGDDSEHLMNGVGQELLDCIGKKDHKGMVECIKALMSNMKDEE